MHFSNRHTIPGMIAFSRLVLSVTLGLFLALPPLVQEVQASSRDAALAKQHMISAANPHASRAGLLMLRAGGSAVDAAIAAELVLSLVEPQSSGIGGGAFMLHYQASDRSLQAYDGRETAPAAATPELFLQADGSPMPFWDAVVGGRAVGTPGLFRMMELAHTEHGRLPWAQLFEPAIELAEEGFKVSPRLHRLISVDPYLKTYRNARDYFYTAEGEALPVGTLLRNKPFADVLRAVAEQGASAFYEGAIAQDIVEAVRTVPEKPGLLALDDLKNYQARSRKMLCVSYRDWEICGMPPPTSGGVAVLQTMKMLEQFELSDLPPDSAELTHLIAEASRLAFADRNRYLADTDFVSVPVEALLDPAYLARRASLIQTDKSLGKAEPGLPEAELAQTLLQTEPPSTTHLSVVDQWGNAVSMTASVENAFGSRVMVNGFLLNNQLTDFSFRPFDDRGQAVANAVAPGKRPRSSMSPTLVLNRDKELVMAIGSPGGSRIIGFVIKTLVASLDLDMDMQAAIEWPHRLNRNGKTDLEAGTSAEKLKVSLEKRGHEIDVRAMVSGLHGIRVRGQNHLEGGADPRREGIALGD
ncbi:gamma-glutamyltransferase [Kiloniella sp. b19]|uniref:gamma-glutamyltransferase n=1 Tax=Kiloniella sp. GXU_MW_B19 TaxID=3141326 RepID=UPI0031D3AC59